MKRMPLRTFAVAALSAVLLSGCATGYLLENQVQSFSAGAPALPAPTTYTFERLPSQANQPSQARLEALTDPILFKNGLRRDDAAPKYTVMVDAKVQRAVSPWADPWDPWGYGPGWGPFGPRVGFGFGWGPFPRMEQPWYQRQVDVIVRERATNRVVYETHASNDGPWLDNETVIAAMLDAAMQGFPNPPPGPRRVSIHLGGKQQQAAVAVPAAGAPVPAAPAAAPAAPAPQAR